MCFLECNYEPNIYKPYHLTHVAYRHLLFATVYYYRTYIALILWLKHKFRSDATSSTSISTCLIITVQDGDVHQFFKLQLIFKTVGMLYSNVIFGAIEKEIFLSGKISVNWFIAIWSSSIAWQEREILESTVLTYYH